MEDVHNGVSSNGSTGDDYNPVKCVYCSDDWAITSKGDIMSKCCQLSLYFFTAAQIAQVAKPIWVALAGQLRYSGLQ